MITHWALLFLVKPHFIFTTLLLICSSLSLDKFIVVIWLRVGVGIGKGPGLSPSGDKE